MLLPATWLSAVLEQGVSSANDAKGVEKIENALNPINHSPCFTMQFPFFGVPSRSSVALLPRMRVSLDANSNFAGSV